MTDNDRAAKIEAVAQAMWLANYYEEYGEGEPLMSPWEDINDYYRDHYRRMAAVALDALEPWGLDALLDSVHPLARVDIVGHYADASAMNGDLAITGWRAFVHYPEGGKCGAGFGTVEGTGPTREAAIRAAVAQARKE